MADDYFNQIWKKHQVMEDPDAMPDWKKTRLKEKRRLKAQDALEKLTNERTPWHSDIPSLLTLKDICAILSMNYRSALRLMHEVLVPMRGVVKIGKHFRIHSWAVERMLNITDRCNCGRPWDDKLALEELKGDASSDEIVKLSTGGLRGGLADQR